MSEDSGREIREALGESEAFLAFQQRLSRVARVNRPVLIIGERGTGKELAAQRLHYLSERWNGPLVALNCATLPATLIEAELFGHEPGAFTGARQRRAGRFESADEGSLFLDEIGNIPMEAQAKILRVVEYGVFERLGSSAPVRVDVRIIAATNANLKELVRSGSFKADLLDRLSFEVLVLPPLRERREDIMLLATHFAGRMAFELGRREAPEFTDEAMQALQSCDWPGNIRELKNVVERAVYRSETPVIGKQTIVFDPFPQHGAAAGAEPARPAEEAPGEAGTVRRALGAAGERFPEWLRSKPLKEAVADLQVAMLGDALEQTRYNQRQAAARLGLTYYQFRGLYRKYGERLGVEERSG